METLSVGDRTGENNFLDGFFGKEKDLIIEFTTSPKFDLQRRMLGKAALAVSDPKQDGDFLKILIASYIFENIAISHLKKLIDQANLTASRRKFILSPDEVVEAYGRIHGYDAIEDKDILQRVIEGVTMPDALEFTESGNSLQLTGIWDSKLGDLTQRTINQRKVYKQGLVQRNLMLHFPEGRTKFLQILGEIKSDIPEKPVSVSSKVRIGYLYPIGSNLSQSAYPRIEVPVQRSTISLLKGMFASGGGIDFTHRAA